MSFQRHLPAGHITQTFPDTVAKFKTAPTPARLKKAKLNLELGVTYLNDLVQKTLEYQFVTLKKSLPCVTSVISKPPKISRVAWDSSIQAVNTGNCGQTVDKLSQDSNHNLQFYTDQYGNVVKVQAVAGQNSNQQKLHFR